jgi:hypothetical protein
MPVPFSILVDIFYPSAGTIFSKEGGFNGHAWLRKLFQTPPTWLSVEDFQFTHFIYASINGD